MMCLSQFLYILHYKDTMGTKKQDSQLLAQIISQSYNYKHQYIGRFLSRMSRRNNPNKKYNNLSTRYIQQFILQCARKEEDIFLNDPRLKRLYQQLNDLKSRKATKISYERIIYPNNSDSKIQIAEKEICRMKIYEIYWREYPNLWKIFIDKKLKLNSTLITQEMIQDYQIAINFYMEKFPSNIMPQPNTRIPWTKIIKDFRKSGRKLGQYVEEMKQGTHELELDESQGSKISNSSSYKQLEPTLNQNFWDISMFISNEVAQE